MKKDTDHGVGSTDHLISIRTAVTMFATGKVTNER